MTKKEILYNMGDSPFMQSLRRGSSEQLLHLRKDLTAHIVARKKEALTSCSQSVFVSLIGSTIAISMLQARLSNVPILYAIGIAGCLIFWGCTYLPYTYKAMRAEKILITLVDAAITEKQRTCTDAPPPRTFH